MNLEVYPVKSQADKKRHEFYSEGPKGKIKKVVSFQKINKRFYNLALGDWDITRDVADYKTRSNNGDRDKVLVTVMSIVIEFLSYYTNAIVLIKGHSREKVRLFQIVINKHFRELNNQYIIRGLCHDGLEYFQPGRNYERFIINTRQKL